MIRVLLVEDQAMVRGALASLLGLEPDIEVVGEAASGPEALAVALRIRPDVVLLDVEMPRATASPPGRGSARHCPAAAS